MLISPQEEQIYPMQHLTMYLGNQSLKLIITDSFFQKNWLVYESCLKTSQEVIYYLKRFNSKYMESVGYDIRDKLIWT